MEATRPRSPPLGGGLRPPSASLGEMWTHHKLLGELVNRELVALRMQRGGDGLALQHHRLPREELVDFVVDLFDLGARLAGDLPHRDGGCLLELLLQLLCLSPEKKRPELIWTKNWSPSGIYSSKCRRSGTTELRTHLWVSGGTEVLEGLNILVCLLLELLIPFQRAVFSATLKPCVETCSIFPSAVLRIHASIHSTPKGDKSRTKTTLAPFF